MKILVTGATGFVGRHVVSELLRNNQQVIATSKNQGRAEQLEWFSQVQYIPCDLNHMQGDFFNFFQQPEILIHLAWEGLPNYNGLFHFERNLLSNYQFLKNMLEHGLERLLITGTCLEYGMQSGCLNENQLTKPDTPYGFAKDTLRKFLEQLQNISNFKLHWLRLFYMYGSGQSPSAVLSQLDKALEHGEATFKMSGGEQLRDYLPVERAAEYISKIAIQGNVQGVINCCSGKPISIRRLVEQHLKKTQKTIDLELGHYPYPDYEPMAFWGDTQKMKAALGDKADNSFKD